MKPQVVGPAFCPHYHQDAASPRFHAATRGDGRHQDRTPPPVSREHAPVARNRTTYRARYRLDSRACSRVVGIGESVCRQFEAAPRVRRRSPTRRTTGGRAGKVARCPASSSAHLHALHSANICRHGSGRHDTSHKASSPLKVAQAPGAGRVRVRRVAVSVQSKLGRSNVQFRSVK